MATRAGQAMSAVFSPMRFLVPSIAAPGVLGPGVPVCRQVGKGLQDLQDGSIVQAEHGSTWLCAFPTVTRELVEVPGADLSVSGWRYAGRLRLALWLAQRRKLALGCIGPLWDSDGFAWRLGDLEHAEWYVGTPDEAKRYDGAICVPALQGLRDYPAKKLLPDRTREVDSLALALVVTHGW